MGGERESIWSVPRWAAWAYYFSFSVFMLIGIVGIGLPQENYSPAAIAGFLIALSPIVIASAGLTLFVIEILDIGVLLMVLSSWLIEKKREWEQKQLEERVDKEFGEGTFEWLRQERDNKNGQTTKRK